MTERRPVIVLDPVEPYATPDYCCHGKASCISCGDWCWLGDNSFDLVASGSADPLCVPCAIKLIPPGTTPLRNSQDHRRADGPHEAP